MKHQHVNSKPICAHLWFVFLRTHLDMPFHQFVVNGWPLSASGPPPLQREDAFFHVAAKGAAQGWDLAYKKEFPEAKLSALT